MSYHSDSGDNKELSAIEKLPDDVLCYILSFSELIKILKTFRLMSKEFNRVVIMFLKTDMYVAPDIRNGMIINFFRLKQYIPVMYGKYNAEVVAEFFEKIKTLFHDCDSNMNKEKIIYLQNINNLLQKKSKNRLTNEDIKEFTKRTISHPFQEKKLHLEKYLEKTAVMSSLLSFVLGLVFAFEIYGIKTLSKKPILLLFLIIICVGTGLTSVACFINSMISCMLCFVNPDTYGKLNYQVNELLHRFGIYNCKEPKKSRVIFEVLNDECENEMEIISDSDDEAGSGDVEIIIVKDSSNEDKSGDKKKEINEKTPLISKLK